MGAGKGRTGPAGGGGGGTDFTSMSDQQIAAAVDNALQAELPNGMQNDITQRMIYAENWNAKPEVVSDEKLKTLAQQNDAIVMYRTVERNRKLNMKSNEIADSTRTNPIFFASGGGEQTYGGGAYFTDSLKVAQIRYGTGDIRTSNTMAAVLNKNAKVIALQKLKGAEGERWIKAHPAAARSLGFKNGDISNPAHGAGSYTALAMAMGYNVVSSNVHNPITFYTVLNRRALTTSTKNYFDDSYDLKGKKVFD